MPTYPSISTGFGNGGFTPTQIPQYTPPSTGGGGGIDTASLLQQLLKNNNQQPNPYLQAAQLGLGALSNYAQASNQKQQSQQQLQLQQAMLGQQGQQGLMNDSLARDTMLNQSAPTGWAQNYEQNTLLKNLVLQQLMNGGNQLTPTNPAIAAMLPPAFKPTISDDWQKVNPFGTDQTLAALQNRQGVLDKISGGKAPALDFTQLGFDPTKAAQANQDASAYRQFTADDYNNLTNPLSQAINMGRSGPLAGGNGGAPGVNGAALAAGIGGAIAPSLLARYGAKAGTTAATAGKVGTGAATAGSLGSGLANFAKSPTGIGLATGIAANYLPQGAPATAARYAGYGAQIGSVIPGIGTGIGAGIGAAVGAIKGHQNATVGDREKFAQGLGFQNLDGLYQHLNSLGPQGQQLANAGLNVIGKQDQAGNANWMQQVQQLIGGSGAPGSAQQPPQLRNPYILNNGGY